MSKRKQPKSKALLWLFLLLPFAGLAQAPASCTNAQLLNTDTCLFRTTTATEEWFSFTADSTRNIVFAENSGDPLLGFVDRIEIYSGNCSALTLLYAANAASPADTIIRIDTSGYIPGQTYYVRYILNYTTAQSPVSGQYRVCHQSNPDTEPLYYDGFLYAYTAQDCGLKYVMGDVQLNRRFVGTVTPPQGVQLPAPLSITGLPQNAVILQAYLYFVLIGNTPAQIPVLFTNPAGVQSTPLAQITGNGAGLTNNATCWFLNNVVPQTTAYRADVTTMIAGNGNYIIDGLPVNLNLTNMQATDADGATLIIIYKDPCDTTNRPARIYLRDGLSLITGAQINNTINVGAFQSFANNINGEVFFSIADVQSGAPANQTFFANQPIPADFWFTTAVPTAFAPNQTNLVFNHFNLFNDCSAVPFVGVYMQNGNTACPALSGNIVAPDTTICAKSGQSVTLSAAAFNPTGTVNYQWSPAIGLSCTNCQTTNAAPTATTTYTLTMTDGLGCVVTDIVTIVVNPLPVADLSGLEINNCGAGSFTYTNQLCNQPGITFSWSILGGVATATTPCSIDINWLNPVTGYVVLVALDQVTGCTASDTIHIPPCCVPEGGELVCNNRTASSLLTDQNFIPVITGNTLTFPGHLIINGVFTVDIPFTFQNCPFLDMGANARIQVLSGQTLDIDNCQFSTKCGFMWDGIYVPDVTSKVNVINGSVIRQAKNAIVSIDGGDYLVENSEMRSNLRGIVVKPHAGAHPGIVRGSAFSKPVNEPFLIAFPALLWWQTTTLHAVEIEGNADITIGDASDPAYLNTFMDMFNAIWSKQSHTKVVNARITGLKFNSNAVNAHKGIVSDGGKQVASPPYYYQLQVGGYNQNEPVTTDTMRVAIETHFSQQVFIYNNTLRNQRNKAIYILLNDNNTIDISGNTILNTGAVNYPMNMGIDVVDCFLSYVGISNNNLLQQGNTYTNQRGIGIRVANTQNFKVYLNLAFNQQIWRYRTGVLLQKLDGKNAVFVYNNTVTFFKPIVNYTTSHYGIKLEDCSDVRIDHNKIERLPTNNWASVSDSVYANKLHGIYFQDSPGSTIYQNDLNRMGNGIFGYGTSFGSTLPCNTFLRCFNGFKFSGVAGMADISDQVLDPANGNPAPTGNTYTANFNSDLTGGISPPINWYESAPVNASMLFGSLLPTNINLPQVISDPSLCGTIFQLAPSSSTERSLEAGTAIQTIQNSSLSPEEKLSMAKNVHRKLRENPDWLQLNTPEDTLYQQFYEQTDSANIGLIRNVEEYAAATDQQQAATENSRIVPAGNIEDNIKVVNEIYTRTWMNGIYDFSQADTATLYMIASQNPGFDGTGVYAARVMLGLLVDDLYGEADYLAPEAELQPTISSALFPNPATDHVFVDLQLTEKQTGIIEILDLNGRLVQSEQVKGGQQVRIGVGKIQAGSYMLRLVVEGETRFTERLVILK